MTDFPDFLDNDDGVISDPDNPFYGLPSIGVITENDPNERITADILGVLGITDFTEVIVNLDNADVTRLRGNRFPNIVDAIIYLNEAGILAFSDVTIDDDGEIGVAIGYEDGYT